MASRNIHPRMPVILLKEDEEEWLNRDVIEPE
jgi:putative SOS response-associated peptidase YedK